MLLVVSGDVRQQNFNESGAAIMERQTARRTPSSVTQMPEFPPACVNLAKELTARCRARALQLTDDEILSITQDLESVIKNLCDYIGRVPTSALGSNAYTDGAVKALSVRGFLEDDMLTNAVNSMPNRKYFHDSNMPRLVEFLQGMYHESDEFGGHLFSSLPEVSEYIEPLYDALFCPLTNQVMTDPVLTESGVTYERRAIEEHFERFADSSENVICPVTKMPLQSKTLMNNASLKSVIAEWTMRNEAMRIRIARTALSLSSTEAMVLEAIHELKSLAKLRGKNREQMHKIGVTRLLARLLDNHNAQIRHSALELLCFLVEDEEGKVSTKSSLQVPHLLFITVYRTIHDGILLLA